MAWKKGEPRGPSPLSGKSPFGADPAAVEAVLNDETQAPEMRFVTVMEMILPHMRDSSNAALARVGTRLATFWEQDMAETIIWTPIKGEK